MTDFRYNTGETRVPWSAVGENYNLEDIMTLIQFLIKGDGAEYEKLLESTKTNISELLKIGAPPGKLSLGKLVETLEGEIDKFLKTNNSTFITNATAGFEIAYRYANLEPGDEVIAPAITFIATVSYPLAVGAKVIFADVDPLTLNMDPEDVRKKITDKTKMIVPVHLGGWPVDMDPIMKLAKENDILVLEDAAHGFGAEYNGKMLGAIGDFGSFSFHEVKNITSFGEGGIVTCQLPFAEHMKKARFLGLNMAKKIKNWLYDVDALEGKYKPFAPGNSSSTEIQALGLLQQLKRINPIIEERRKNAEYLTDRFRENEAIIPQLLDKEHDGIKSTYHLYLLQIDPEKAKGDIQVLKQKLNDRGVTNIPHFGPLYKFSVLKDLGYNEDEIAKTCPVTEEAFNHRFTHLPLYGLTQDQINYMADAVLDAVTDMQTN